MLPVAIVCALVVHSPQLEQGIAELKRYELEAARTHLTAAVAAGPYDRDAFVSLFEHLGMVHAYLDEAELSLDAFDMLLALEPGHALSYTLSPKVTFLFEQARERAETRPSPGVDVSWPRDHGVDQPLPITLEVVADPRSFLTTGRLSWRVGGEAYRQLEVALPAPGSFVRELVPPVAPAATADQNVQLYFTAFDARGNEVYRVGSAERPREVLLRYTPPTPWYEHWWVWAIAGTVVAAGVSTTVYALTREPPDRVPVDTDTSL